jgi:predicted DNA-binding transcriptional regulator YafY
VRADRLLSIILLLQVRGRVTAGELAERLEVSRRTIYRDMEVLSGAGIPVVAERGAGGGWYLLDTYETKLTGLNLSEIQALFVPMPDRLLSDLGLRQASEAALIKLLAALPEGYRRDAEYVRQRIHIDGTVGRQPDDDTTFLPILQAAIWQERKVQLVYQLSTGPIVEPVLDPLGLVAKGSMWYLVAVWEARISVYRVSLIQDARMSDEPCVRPEGFDLAAFWKRSSEEFLASLPRYPATVRVSAEVRPQLCGRCRYVERVDPPDARGWTTAYMQFETEEEACRYLIGFGDRVEVLAPHSLQERMRAVAEQVLSLYAQQGLPAMAWRE